MSLSIRPSAAFEMPRPLETQDLDKIQLKGPKPQGPRYLIKRLFLEGRFDSIHQLKI